MARVYDPEREEIERREEYDARDYAAAVEAERREHEYRLAKLKYSTEARHKALYKTFVALCKGPAWFVLAITLPMVIRAGKDIPKFLQDFMNL